MDMDVVCREPVARDLGAEHAHVSPDPRQRRLRGLLHHLAELAGDRELALAGYRRRLDEQHLAADRGPGESGGDAGVLGAPALLGEVPPLAQELPRTLCRDRRLALHLSLGDLPRHLAADAPDLALEVPYAGLARVLVDDRLDRRVGEGDLAAREAVL